MASQMVIAVEEHWGSAETERLRDDWLEASGLPGTKNHATRAENLKTLWDFDARIPVMDDAGISRQVISLSSPGVQGIRNPEQATATAHRLNRTQYELMKRFPDRFYGFANLPLCDPNGAADELEYCISHYGFVGALIHGHCYGKYLDDPCYNVLWEAAQAHNALLYMHITDPDPRHTLDLGRYPVLSGPCWSWGVEAATHALRLMVGGVFDRFPGARFAMGHMGEGLPYADAPAGSLPYGNKRLLEIGRALASDPKLLLLDEPAAGMNDSESAALVSLIRKIQDLGVTVLLVEHNIRLVMGLSDRVTVLNYGNKIADGTPEEVMANQDVIDAYLGKEDDDGDEFD